MPYLLKEPVSLSLPLVQSTSDLAIIVFHLHQKPEYHDQFALQSKMLAQKQTIVAIFDQSEGNTFRPGFEGAVRASVCRSDCEF